MELKSCMQTLGICVIIPTFNNAGTLREVIDSCLDWTTSLLVVNDGSTDDTDEILSSYADKLIFVINYSRNRGKGYALKRGFAFAKAHGFKYAITLDADGQHRALDIPVFVKAIIANPNALVIGSRDLEAKNMPAGNTFANKFSNFWFKIQTLRSLPDTQTGYRLYPLSCMGSLWWVTSRYEAELEMLVFAAWHGIKLVPVPIHIYYAPIDERVSHFRPGVDFFRISVLNIILCILAIIYGGPRMLINKLFFR
ncbi:glycosyltransferase family 2 protein [Parabacteroides sp.]